ncbi:MAG: ribonuclease Z [Bacteroidales bacterium]|nr:ribonuclease Z [Bacteroidales bacterium]
MSFSLTILGSSSALPKPDRFTTAHVLNAHERFFLIDCGEGTQIQLRRFKIRFGRIHHIFITHLHGDHFFGLPGILSSFNLMGRKNPLHVYGPDKLQDIIMGLYETMGEKLNYEIIFTKVNFKQPELILETNNLSVTSIPLKHKIPTVGYVFREKDKLRKISRDLVTEMGLGVKEIISLKAGHDVIRPDGTCLESEKYTTPAAKPRSYAFISDTRYSELIIPMIKGVDLLYHEATYLDEMKRRAKETGHSTAAEAARVADLAGVRKLLIGHFSARYRDSLPLLREAQDIFPNTVAAEDGLCIDVDNS